MIDASFTVAPRQRNTREENKKIKNGEGDDLWNDKPNKKKHKDIDARCTGKNGETFYGYKNHAKVDTKSKFINKYLVTDASVHDSQALDDLLEEKDKEQKLHEDSAYTGEEQEKTIAKYEIKNNVHKKGYRNKPLTQEQKANNTKKSKIRAKSRARFWVYGAKYEWFSTKIVRYYKSNRNYRVNQLNLQLV